MIGNESGLVSTHELLRRGLRNEARLDRRVTDAGQYVNTSQGDVVISRSSTGEVVPLVDVGNGSQNLQVIGAPGDLSALAVQEALSMPRPETQVNLYGKRVESAVGFKPIQANSASVQAVSGSELVNAGDGSFYYGSIVDPVQVYGQ